MSIQTTTVLWLVLTSAVVSAAVSGIMTLAGQHLERRSRKKELLVAKAVELAVEKNRSTTALIQHRPNQDFAIDGQRVLVTRYYEFLKPLLLGGPTLRSRRRVVSGLEVRGETHNPTPDLATDPPP